MRSGEAVGECQALAQSVFGNLAARGRLGCLAGLAHDEAGRPLFFESEAGAFGDAFLDSTTSPGLLGEPGPASRRRLNLGAHRVVVDCTLAEAGIAGCVCPELDPDDTKYCNRLFPTDANHSLGCSEAVRARRRRLLAVPSETARLATEQRRGLSTGLDAPAGPRRPCGVCAQRRARLRARSRRACGRRAGDPTFGWSEWQPPAQARRPSKLSVTPSV